MTKIKIYPAGYRKGRAIVKDVTKNDKPLYHTNAKEYDKEFEKAQPRGLQAEMEDALAKKDFATYNKYRAEIKGENEKVKFGRTLEAIQILKQKVNNIKTELQNYNPNLKEYKIINEDIDLFLERLDNMFNQLVPLRNRLGKLNKEEERMYKSMDTDVDRYAFEISKIEGLLSKLSGKEPKLLPEEVKMLKYNSDIKKKEKEIMNVLENLEKYGLDQSTKELNILRSYLSTGNERDREITSKAIGDFLFEEEDVFNDLAIEVRTSYDNIKGYLEYLSSFKQIENMGPTTERNKGNYIRRSEITQLKRKKNELTRKVKKITDTKKEKQQNLQSGDGRIEDIIYYFEAIEAIKKILDEFKILENEVHCKIFCSKFIAQILLYFNHHHRFDYNITNLMR